jgi:hypothetical protein
MNYISIGIAIKGVLLKYKLITISNLNVVIKKAFLNTMYIPAMIILDIKTIIGRGVVLIDFSR